ncbi:hypothetical protein [Novosphingobium sp. RL4]|uniref:hypothetical protein n=1 Tax=Novosphingobium sp. RL4 TaxID=3109595 RepID=UPI002D775C01|nr:hypothetical protein [Novosphingobium sp. RL4]WRT91332.1 hypothetical protein U9J33_08810 [Novosphingobium sp. RL4]
MTALGGQTVTARILDVTPRAVRRWLTGERPLHDGIMREVGRALIRHADHCRKLERKISPAFAGNLTERQLQRMGKPDARRADQRKG